MHRLRSAAPALPRQSLGHDVLAALAVRRGWHHISAHRHPQPVRRMARHSPAAGPAREVAPVYGIVWQVGRLVDLLDFRGVFGDETVRLDEIGEDVVARPMAADAP